MEIQMQKFLPEGWRNKKENFNLQQLYHAKESGTVLQGFVNSCDENCNLQIFLDKDIMGIIPRNEMDVINSDNFGITKQNICKY